MRTHGSQVPDAVAPPPRHPRFPLVDGMRAIAVLCVVIVHCAVFSSTIDGSLSGRLLAHANIGVALFFEISGFLLFRPFVAWRSGGAASPRFTAYGKRRALRILPAYWLVLTAVLVVPGLPGIGAAPAWPMYTLTQTIPIYHGPSCSSLVLGCSLAQTWSLGAEVSFYLALPLFVLATERLTRRLSLRAWAATQALTLATLSAASVIVQFAVLHPAPAWVGWTLPGTVLWFALGMGLAVVSVLGGSALRGESAPGVRPATENLTAAVGAAAWAAAAAIYLGISLALPPTPFLSSAGSLAIAQVSFGVISALLLAPAVLTSGSGLVGRVAGNRVASWVGLVSYGIFLWHYPLLERLGFQHGTAGFVRLLIEVLLLSSGCAAVSYYALERPLMRLKYRSLRDRPLRPRLRSAA